MTFLATIKASQVFLGFGLMVVFVPGYTGSAIPSGWLFLAAVLPWFLFQRIEMTSTHWLGLAFFAYACLSTLWAEDKIGTVMGLVRLILFGMAFLYACRADLRSLTIGLALGLIPSIGVGLYQAWFHYAVGQSVLVSGLFVNNGYFANAAAMILCLALFTRLWWITPIALIGVLIPGAKSQFVFLGCAALFHFRHDRRVLLPLAGLALLAFFAFVVGWRISGTWQRLDIWKVAIATMSPFGHGPGSFEATFPPFQNLEKAIYAHNDWLQIIWEYGLGAWPLFLAALPLLVSPLFAAFAILAFFQFPLETPILLFLGAIFAGIAYRERNVLRDLRLPRRSGLSYRDQSAGVYLGS